jgi:hypothetical protein
MAQPTNRRLRYRSVFWPIMLITIGVLVLLGNLSIFSTENWVALLNMWPLLLIAIGLDLLFGRGSRVVSAWIGLGTAALMMLIMLIGPALGLAGDWERQTFTGSVPLEGASEASVTLNLTLADTHINALPASSENLLEADLAYIGGSIVLDQTGSAHKSVTLEREGPNNAGWLFGILDWFKSDDDLRWNIDLSGETPLALYINFNLGDSNLDLRNLQLSELRLDGDIGDVTLVLPAVEEQYTVDIDGGLGNFDITLPEDADIDISITGGVGEFTIRVPDGAAVRITAKTGIGKINMPNSFDQIEWHEDVVGENGIWMTRNFDEAAHQITIAFDGGVGDLNVRQ